MRPKRLALLRHMVVAALLIFVTRLAPAETPDPWQRARDKMVDDEIVAAGVKNPRVIEAMRAVPRHKPAVNQVLETAPQDADRPEPTVENRTVENRIPLADDRIVFRRMTLQLRQPPSSNSDSDQPLTLSYPKSE